MLTRVFIEMQRFLEADLYKPIQGYLLNMLNRNFSNYHLEITARGNYSETVKHLVRHDIVFSFLKKASPDLTGFILKVGIDKATAHSSDVESFITVEVKPDKLKLANIFQAKMYGDLFYAKYALLISPEIIGEEIRRLHNRLYILNRFRDWKVYTGQAVVEKIGKSIIKVQDIIWFPETPF